MSEIESRIIELFDAWQIKFVVAEFIILDIFFLIYTKTQQCKYVKQLKVDGKTFFLKINVRLLLALGIWKLVSLLVLQNNFAIVNQWSGFLMIVIAIPLELMSCTRLEIENLLRIKLTYRISYKSDRLGLMFIIPMSNIHMILLIITSTKLHHLFALDSMPLVTLGLNIMAILENIDNNKKIRELNKNHEFLNEDGSIK